MDQQKSKKTTMTGTVVNSVSDKTAIVRVTLVKKHPKYDKQYTVHQKYVVHDEKNESQKDDVVEIESMSPRSKLKRWKFVRKVK